MESQNIFEKDTCQVQQVSVIRKIHNMQWLKNNPPSSGHIKLKTNKESIKNLKDDMNVSQLTTETTISVPNISANDNLELINPINTVSIMNDSKYNCSLESKTNKPFLIRDSKCLWDINDETYSSVINDQTLILQELEEEEMVSMAIADSMFTLHLEEQLRIKEQEEKELNTDECDLPSLETKSNISEISKKNICDNNNNDDNVNKISKSDLEQNTELKTDVKITEVQCDATKNEVSSLDSNKGDQSNIIDLNKEADTSLNLSNSDTISELNNKTSVCTPSTTSNSNDESKKVQEEVTNTYERKEESKTVIKKDTVASTPNTNSDVTLKQNTENKMKCGLKHSINTSTEKARRTLDRRDKPRQAVASQSKKESMIGNPSSELTVRRDMKHLKRNEHGKTTFTNSVNKQYRVNHVCHMYKKENGSVSKMHNNSLKPELNTINETTNCSNSFNSMQSMKKPSFNTTEKYSTHKKMLEVSNADNKYKNTEQNTVYLVPLVSKEREKEFIVKSKLDKEVKESNKSGITKFPNEHSINNNVEQRQTNTNPFLPNSSLPVSNEMQTDAKNVKDTVYSDLPSKNMQFENIPCTNISYGYPVSQHNTKQELIPSHQNFTHCTPDLFFMNYSLNNTSPKFYSNANTMPLSRYGNVQTMSSNSSGVKLPNCSNPNAIPSNTGNTNGFQYQMPNVPSYSNQNIRPNFCVHPMMPPEEQFNTHMYGYNPTYFVNPVCACRNDCYPYPQNWKIPTNQPVPLMPGPYYYNCNSFYNENVQSQNTMHKNTAFAARPIQSHAHVHIPYEQNLQRKSPYTFGYDVRSSQNDRCSYNLKAQGNMTNNSKNMDSKSEQRNHEFSNENAVNNLPMVSPKACMFYGSKVSTNINTVKSQVKYSNTSEHLSTNASIDNGKAKSEIQPNNKTQY